MSKLSSAAHYPGAMRNQITQKISNTFLCHLLFYVKLQIIIVIFYIFDGAEQVIHNILLDRKQVCQIQQVFIVKLPDCEPRKNSLGH